MGLSHDWKIPVFEIIIIKIISKGNESEIFPKLTCSFFYACITKQQNKQLPNNFFLKKEKDII